MPGTFNLITLQTSRCFLYCTDDLIRESRLSSGSLRAILQHFSNHRPILLLYSSLKKTRTTLSNIHLFMFLKKMGKYLYLKELNVNNVSLSVINCIHNDFKANCVCGRHYARISFITYLILTTFQYYFPILERLHNLLKVNSNLFKRQICCLGFYQN